jgi:hypothetical protein
MQSRRLVSKHSEDFLKKRFKRKIWLVILIFITITTWSFCLFNVLRLETFNISTVEIYGADSDIASSLRNIASQKIEGDYMGIVPKSSYFFYPKNDIIASVFQASPRISKVNIDISSFDTLLLKIEEKKSDVIGCLSLPEFDGNKILPEDQNRCFAIDDKGILFKAVDFNKNIDSHVYFKTLQDDNTNTFIGNHIIDPVTLGKIESVFDFFKKNNINSKAVLLKDTGEYEFYLENKNSRNPEDDFAVLYMNDDRSIDEQLQNFILFWNKVRDNKDIKNKSFEYVDVRYGSNVFFRLDDERIEK